MTYEEKELLELTRQNNYMLRGITTYLANEARNANNENTNDMLRNILANLISNVIDGNVRY